MKIMKFNLLIKVLVVFMAVSVVSCTKLKEKVFDEVPGTSLITNPANAPGLVDPAYAELRQLISLWNEWGLEEASTDELQVPTRGTDWYDNGSWQAMHWHTWTSQHAIINSCVEYYYDRYEQSKYRYLLSEKIPLYSCY